MNPVALKFCPRCGSVGYQYRAKKYWYCPVCLFTYYHNVAASASVILEVAGSVLMLARNREPGLGLLCLPGGFIDSQERAEDAASRECFEETGLRPSLLEYVGSWPNEYRYRGVVYHTCDFYFADTSFDSLDLIKPNPEEVATFQLVGAAEIETAPIAFESHRNAVRAWFERRSRIAEHEST